MLGAAVTTSVLGRSLADTVGHGHTPALQAAVASLGADRLLLGTDFPYQAGDGFRAAVGYVRQAGLPAQDATAVLDRNAAHLFGLSHPA